MFIYVYLVSSFGLLFSMQHFIYSDTGELNRNRRFHVNSSSYFSSEKREERAANLDEDTRLTIAQDTPSVKYYKEMHFCYYDILKPEFFNLTPYEKCLYSKFFKQYFCLWRVVKYGRKLNNPKTSWNAVQFVFFLKPQDGLS